MAAAAILNSEEMLPFIYFYTNLHQLCWERCESYIERTVLTKNAYLTNLKMAAAAISNFEKLLPLILDQSSPNLVGML